MKVSMICRWYSMSSTFPYLNRLIQLTICSLVLGLFELGLQDADLEALRWDSSSSSLVLVDGVKNTHLNRVRSAYFQCPLIFGLLAQGGKGRILPILQVDDRISNAVNFVISQHPFDGCNHGSTFNPALLTALAFMRAQRLRRRTCSSNAERCLCRWCHIRLPSACRSRRRTMVVSR